MHLILPALVLGTATTAVIARMTRSSMLEVLREDYVRTARAKGLSPTRVVVVHALRNALIPVLTVVGLQTGSLLAGAVLTETIFSWPGIGKWLIDSIARRDYPVVQAGILISALTFIGVNLVVDLLYGVVNPRIRGGGIDVCRAGPHRAAEPCSGVLAGFAANRGALAALFVFSLITVACLFAPLVAPYDPSSSSATRCWRRRSGPRAVARASCWAPTSSGATC